MQAHLKLLLLLLLLGHFACREREQLKRAPSDRHPTVPSSPARIRRRVSSSSGARPDRPERLGLTAARTNKINRTIQAQKRLASWTSNFCYLRPVATSWCVALSKLPGIPCMPRRTPSRLARLPQPRPDLKQGAPLPPKFYLARCLNRSRSPLQSAIAHSAFARCATHQISRHDPSMPSAEKL